MNEMNALDTARVIVEEYGKGAEAYGPLEWLWRAIMYGKQPEFCVA
jgi:hypothetical protein